MEKIYAPVTPPKIVGYLQVWYRSKKQSDEEVGIRFSSNLEMPGMQYFLRENGAVVITTSLKEKKLQPFSWDYKCQIYLVDSSIVVLGDLDLEDGKHLEKKFPTHIISILSQTEEALKGMAKRFQLDLEDLVGEELVGEKESFL